MGLLRINANPCEQQTTREICVVPSKNLEPSHPVCSEPIVDLTHDSVRRKKSSSIYLAFLATSKRAEPWRRRAQFSENMTRAQCHWSLEPNDQSRQGMGTIVNGTRAEFKC